MLKEGDLVRLHILAKLNPPKVGEEPLADLDILQVSQLVPTENGLHVYLFAFRTRTKVMFVIQKQSGNLYVSEGKNVLELTDEAVEPDTLT